jgi:hypothetical protein
VLRTVLVGGRWRFGSGPTMMEKCIRKILASLVLVCVAKRSP